MNMPVMFVGLRLLGALPLVLLPGWDIVHYFDDADTPAELVATVKAGHIVTTADGRYSVLWAAIRFRFDDDNREHARRVALACVDEGRRDFLLQNAGFCCVRRSRNPELRGIRASRWLASSRRSRSMPFSRSRRTRGQSC